MLLYIQKDKNRKREIDITKKGLINSAKFVKEWMRVNNKNFNEYIHHRDGKSIIAVDHYLKNKIEERKIKLERVLLLINWIVKHEIVIILII